MPKEDRESLYTRCRRQVNTHIINIIKPNKMKSEKTKNYGDYAEIESTVQETVVKPHDTVSGEIWYN